MSDFKNIQGARIEDASIPLGALTVEVQNEIAKAATGGTYRVVATLAQRNSIPVGGSLNPDGISSGQRTLGMSVHVAQEGNTYTLSVEDYFLLDAAGRLYSLGQNSSWELNQTCEIQLGNLQTFSGTLSQGNKTIELPTNANTVFSVGADTFAYLSPADYTLDLNSTPPTLTFTHPSLVDDDAYWGVALCGAPLMDAGIPLSDAEKQEVTALALGTGLHIDDDGNLSVDATTLENVPSLGANTFYGDQLIAGQLTMNGNVLLRGAGDYDDAGDTAEVHFGDPNHGILGKNGYGIQLFSYLVPHAITVKQTTGQLGFGVDFNGINNSAAAQLDSTTRGSLLTPRMNTTQRDAIPQPLPEGLAIYNTTSKLMEVWNGTSWISGGSGGSGGSVPEGSIAVANSTGASETNVMSQKATTDAINTVNAKVVKMGSELVRLLDYINPADNDHTAGFQAAIDYANLVNGSLVWGHVPGGIKIYDTLKIKPLANRNEVHIHMRGHTDIAYKGPSGTNLPGGKPVFDIVGLRFSDITNVGINIDPGIRDIYAWNLDTADADATHPNAASSTTHITFANCGVLLGDGINNTGWRFGHKSGGGGDLSNIYNRNCIVYGKNSTTPGDADGAQYAIAGQTGYRYEGRNVLSNTIDGGLIAYCYHGVTTVTEAVGMTAAQYDSELSNGYAINGAGGILLSNELVFSHNRISVLYASVQSLTFRDTRHEDNLMELLVTDSADSGIIKFDGVQIDNCHASHPQGFVNGSVIYLGRPSVLKIVDTRIAGQQIYGDHMIIMNSFSGRSGVASIEGGIIKAVDPFVRFGNKVGGGDYTGAAGEVKAGHLYVSNVMKLGADNLEAGMFTNQQPSVNSTKLVFDFETGYSDSITKTMSSDAVGIFGSQSLSNVATIQYQVNGSAVSLPLTLAAGSVLTITITRSTAGIRAAVTLTK